MLSRLVAAAAAVAVLAPLSAASSPAHRHPDRHSDHHSHHHLSSAAAADATVTVAGMAFTPRSVKVTLGSTVTWSFPDVMAHTTTSDQGFWDSGSKSAGAKYPRTFTSAGKFPYHCTFHPSMRGTVKVPLVTTGAPKTGWTLRWSTQRGTGGIEFDVQVRRGSGRWKSFRDDTTKSKGRFNPARSGTYQVRARTTRHGAKSGWSPVAKVKIT